MKKIFLHCLLCHLLTMFSICLNIDAQSQAADTIPTIHLPLPYEDVSLYEFASVRLEDVQTEIPPNDLVQRKFERINKIFPKDSLRFTDATKSFWIKFTISNNLAEDTIVAMIFPQAVSKAVLYEVNQNRLRVIGKTGFIIAVLKRDVPYHHARIDIPVKASSRTDYYIQVVLFNGGWMPVMPVLETFKNAEMEAFGIFRMGRQMGLLLHHLFMGIFFMFFVFGFIKYLVLGKDKAYLYYSLMGLCAGLLTVAQSEFPPFELPFFENLRGIELSNLLLTLTIIMQGLFILEIVGLHHKYPRLTRVFKAYLLVKLLISMAVTIGWIVKMKGTIFVWFETYDALFFIFLMLLWVIYLGRNRKGFYRFIFLGALTILIASTAGFAIRWFNLYYLLPSWISDDSRSVVVRLLSFALVIDLSFYFTGLAHRDKEVERDKIRFQQQLIEQLETNRQFQEKFTAELELQVIERTAEVVEEKAVVERQKDVIEKEKEKSDELLLNILPSEVAAELKEKGYTTAKSFDEVTVLFSDIKGFTHVAEKMSAQELVKEIDTYFSAFDHIMQNYGLEKIKTIGDAYISAGGLPEKNAATAYNVVEAAIAMQQKVESFKVERQLLNRPYFELRIGIHTGPVVAGVVGIKKFQYDIWGDTVNLAARMEQSGKPGKINISEKTYELIKEQFNCVHRGKIDAKNKGEMDMYFVE